MSPTLPRGVLISDLSTELQPIARALDAERSAARTGDDQRADGRLGASEVRWAREHTDLFSGVERPQLDALARLFGLENAPSSGREWAERKAFAALGYARGAVALGDRVYVLDERRHDIPCYEPATDTWSNIPVPNPRVRLDGAAIGMAGGRLICAGGHDLGGVPFVWNYDPESGSWSSHQKMTARGEAAMASVGGKAYILGGGTNQYGLNPSNVAEVYDPATGSVSPMANLPVARQGGSAIALGEKIYLVGGHTEVGSVSRRIDVFDTTTGQWQAPLTALAGTFRPSLWIEDGKIHVAGGENDATRGSWGSNAEHMIIDPQSGKVTRGTTLPNGQYHSAAYARTDEGRLFLFSRDPDYHRGTGGAHTLEFADKPAPAPVEPPRSITNIQITNVEVNNRVSVHHVENHETNVVNVVVNDIDVSFEVLPFARLGSNVGYFAGDFFIRTADAGSDLLQVGQGVDGQPYLVGQSTGRSPAPKNCKLDLCVPTANGMQVVPFRTDDRGEFTVRLPEGATGRAYIVSRESQQAVPFDLPV